ncbi:MAG: hypothetical protein JWQ54_1045 [Mucilaginibacter sp.]|nr:hypothetical protein [Mucilaginibacter sp.]
MEVRTIKKDKQGRHTHDKNFPGLEKDYYRGHSY